MLGFIVIETSMAVALAFVALYYCPDEEWSHHGHQFVGVLLAFLAVFRTQNSHTLWEQGRINTGKINTAARCLADEILGSLVQSHVASDSPSLPREAHEMARLLKLAYFIAVEHVRSSDGHEAWDFAQRIAFSHASDEEIALLMAEFGPAQPGISRHLVLPVPVPGSAVRWKPPKGHRASTLRLENRYASAPRPPDANGVQAPPPSAAALDGGAAASPDGVCASLLGEHTLKRYKSSCVMKAGSAAASHASDADAFQSNPHDPTRGKFLVCVPACHLPCAVRCLRSASADSFGHALPIYLWCTQVVVTWLRVCASRVGAIVTSQGAHLDTRRVAEGLDTLLVAFQGMHRVHSVYLPLPYCQLLKIVMLCWVFSLPFVLANEVGRFLPFIMFLVGISFFGIDQVGAELEGPYGIDDNDLPVQHSTLNGVSRIISPRPLLCRVRCARLSLLCVRARVRMCLR